ncbi:antibiotic biosynthesis monooxygenase [Taibaiella soli]|uniref:ABM domain-containing protein n=1 Tax=Taibaiella soli TaxID=1649169 RepID=A0A2W2C148_9BACT|nr:antibiotic biosynthesis monooxygenase [Taibaiella soli]PZF73743.1 hypothetical protein DN068_07030 [Taibaiella soli]
MITVKVTYTVKSEFVQQNLENINGFMQDFKEMKHVPFRYNVYLLEDGKTFLHLAHYQNEAAQKQILAVPSFKLFQERRDASDIGHSHKVEIMKTVDVSTDIFG